MFKISYSYSLKDGRKVDFSGTWPVNSEKNRLQFSEHLFIAQKNCASITELKYEG